VGSKTRKQPTLQCRTGSIGKRAGPGRLMLTFLSLIVRCVSLFPVCKSTAGRGNARRKVTPDASARAHGHDPHDHECHHHARY